MKTPALLLLLLLVTACQKQKFDIVIRGGTVYDGSGSPGVTSDVGINADTIAFIGDLSGAAGKTEINAAGLAVAPGFINMLSWATETLIIDGKSQADIRQGVTLEVFGEGWSMGPLNEDMKANMRADMQRNPEWKFDIDWTTLNEYLESLQR
ncbi:MAG TPA: D-aminoacylase, partial [Cyclobacteriaceae bacterium]|nr:D-aminoacylase [Cyclobacteriaceae bacterium]